MSGIELRGKSLAAVARDVANGFFTINPLTLKKVAADSFKTLHQHLKKTQRETRNERFPQNDAIGIRHRNLRLQRLHQAINVLEHCAKERRVIL